MVCVTAFSMDGRMDGWVDEEVMQRYVGETHNRRMDGWMDGWINRWMDEEVMQEACRWRALCAETYKRWVDGWMDGWMV